MTKFGCDGASGSSPTLVMATQQNTTLPDPPHPAPGQDLAQTDTDAGDEAEGTVVLEGPDRTWKATRGGTVPGVGRVDLIVRWGSGGQSRPVGA